MIPLRKRLDFANKPEKAQQEKYARAH